MTDKTPQGGTQSAAPEPPVAPSPSTSGEQLDVAVADKQPRVGPDKIKAQAPTPLGEQPPERVGPHKVQTVSPSES